MTEPTPHPPRTRRIRAAHRGMTLIEVLVALLIFSFGLLGLVGLQGRAHTFAMSAEDSNRAALFANEIVTSVVLQPGAGGTIVAPSAAAWSASAASALPNGSVVFGTLPTPKQLPITVYWKSPTAPSTSASNAYTTAAVLP